MLNLLDIHRGDTRSQRLRRVAMVTQPLFRRQSIGWICDRSPSRANPAPPVFRASARHGPSTILWSICAVDVNISNARPRPCLCHQIRHAVFQPPDQPRGYRGLLPPTRSPIRSSGRWRQSRSSGSNTDEGAPDGPPGRPGLLQLPRRHTRRLHPYMADFFPLRTSGNL